MTKTVDKPMLVGSLQYDVSVSAASLCQMSPTDKTTYLMHKHL